MFNEAKIYLPYLMAELHRASFTGRLGLVEGDVDRMVFFNNGSPVQVQSRLQEETLGRILLDEGKITVAQYNDMLNALVKTSKPAGEILITQGVLGPQDVFSALEFQSRKKLINCFRMVDFSHVLFEEAVPPEALIASVDMGEVILSGVMSNYTVDRLLGEFPADEETVFTAGPAKQGLSVRIGPKESRLLRSLSGGVALARLMASGQDLHYLLTVLYAFHALDLIAASEIDQPNMAELGIKRPEQPRQPARTSPAAEPQERPAAQERAAPPKKPISPAAPVKPVEPEPDLDSQAAEEESFSPPTLASIMDGKIDPQLAHKVLSLGRDDYFTLLGVNQKADKAIIKSSFYRLLKKYRLEHIEEEYGWSKERELAERLLDQATVAYRVLTDPDSLKEYTKALKSKKGAQNMKIPPGILADVEAQKGNLAVRNKRWQEAEDRYRKAIGLCPKEPSYYYQMGKMLYLKALDETPAGKQLPEEVRRPLLKALALDPRYDKPRLYLGYLAKRNGNLGQAIKEFTGALECNPQNHRAESELRMLKRRMRSAKQ